ncbi:MAG: RND transporter [Deltaproteobacteria bacterium]|nr:RND transporter [Deltaproteobacteria bacterium]TLN03966.1 MAG: RND transporter [bacterium]
MAEHFFTRLTSFVHRGIRRHLEWIFRITTRRPLLVFVIAAFLLLPASLSILSTRFESDIFKLFPAEKGPLKLFLETLEWTGGARQAVFLLEGEPEQLIPEADAFAARLKEQTVDGKPAFARITYRVFDTAEAEAFARFIGYAVIHPELFLDRSQVDSFARRLTPEAIEQALLRTQTELASQMGMGLRDLAAADPLSLRDLVLPRLKAASQALNLDPDSPYFLSRDGRVLIMIAEPAKPVNDMDFARKLVAGINHARQDAQVAISCTGAHLSAVIDESVMKRNIIVCIISSLFVVLGLFFLTYRRFLPTLLIPLILLYGVTLALGTAGVFLPSIHIISFAFTALIIGLGTDYSIHLYDRFYSERSKGSDTAEALRRAVTDTGHGLFTAAVTTALPFLALVISDVRALSELGLLVGLGVLFSLYGTFLFLPPLLVFSERRFPGTTYTPLPGFGLGRVWSFSRRHRRVMIPLSLLLVAGSLAASAFLTFEGELKNLQPRSSEAFLTQEKLEKHLSLSPKQLLVTVDGKNLEGVIGRGSRIALLAERYQEKGQLVSWSSLDRVVNSPEAQREILVELRKRPGAARWEQQVAGALERNGFALEPFQDFLTGLAGLKNAEPTPAAEGVAELSASPLRGVVERHLVQDENGWHLLVYLYYSGKEFSQQDFLRDLAALDPTARATSVDLVSNQLAQSVQHSFFWGFLLGGALVLCLLLAHFESLFGIFASLFPVLSGVVAMTGLMAITGMGLNFMNAMVLVTILGMGSDYGLHIAHRVAGAQKEREQGEYVQAGRAVLLSALTTVAGFGSLAFTDYGAMSSIGWATNYGIGATALFALVFLPAFLPRRSA